jgi:AP2-associated kinase
MMNKRLSVGGVGFPEMEALTIFHDVCEAVEFMHQMDPPIAHRDVKVENVLRFEGKGYKLCDLGSASTAHCVPGEARSLANNKILQLPLLLTIRLLG